MNLIRISTIDDSRICSYKSMKDNLVDSQNNSLFVAEGSKVVLKLLKSNLELISILAKEEFYNKNSELVSGLVKPTLYVADDEILKLIIGFKMHTGVMALAQKPFSTDISDQSETIVVLNGIVDSENIGSIVRNCAAFGIKSLIVDKESSSPYLRRAVRVSMGTIFEINMFVSNNIIVDLLRFKKSGYQIISAEINKNAIRINEFIFPDKKIIIFGSESKGINPKLLDISDSVIYIPITNSIESLNVASSSAIILSRIML